MKDLAVLQPVDYLVIGHVTTDITPTGNRIGGTVTFSALTAQALGYKVGVITSWANDLPLGELSSIPFINCPTEKSTVFKNIDSPSGRSQIIYSTASSLDYYQIPEPWRTAPIVHLAPVAQEVEPSLVRNFPDALIGVTPQGWLRTWDTGGHVSQSEWPEARFVLERSSAAVISSYDVGHDDHRIEEMASACPILVVTDGKLGARLFWHGDVRRYRALEVNKVDSTGAGDIFATAFFCRLYSTRDPWEAARFATQLATLSVTRSGLQGIPTQEEIQESLVEVY
jgi:sugar/nucleoside kinase (ribokinase family)